MRGLRRVAHAPPWPAEHARLACFARIRGPAAPRRQSLRSVAPSRGDPPRDGPIGNGQLVDVRSIAGCNVHSNSFALTRELSCFEMALAPSNADARMLGNVRAVQ